MTEIDREPLYRPEDARFDYDVDLADPGEYPYTRGTRAARKVDPSAFGNSDETIVRELSGEGPASRSNAQFRFLLEHGATGLDVIGDGPTVLFMDPDHPHARHAVGNTGVSLCRAEDYLELYRDIPLGEVSISHSLPAGFAIAGIYLATRNLGGDPSKLRGSVILGPIYGEDTGYGGNNPFELNMRLAIDSIAFATEHMPRFHPYVEDTYFISDGSIGIVDEMALGFIEIREITRRLIAAGVAVDAFAPRFALLVNCRMDFFGEIAKIRAARRLFARMMHEEFGAIDPRSLAINVAAHSSGATMTAQQLPNNIVRGTTQALSLYLAGVRAMEISAFDEPIRTPSEEAHLVGLRAQQVVALETGVTEVSDPLGGSYYVEALTSELEAKIRERYEQIESMGTVADLYSQGYFRSLFEEAMIARAREVSDGSKPVVGVNCLQLPPERDTILRSLAEERIEPYYSVTEEVVAWKSRREISKVTAALDHLERVGRDRDANVIPAIVAALEAEATMGESIGVLREAYGSPFDPLGGATRPAA